MNTGHLQTFITLAEAGSFGAAAKRLFLTPPAVKYALDALEAETGLTLFLRTHTGLELTGSGAVFAEYASKALALVDEGISYAFDASPNGRRRVDAPWAWMPLRDVLFHRAFCAFQEAHPTVDVLLRRVGSFVGEHYDVINGYADVVHTHAVSHALCSMPLCCIVAGSHPLAGRGSIPIEDLAPYELFVPVQELVNHMDRRTRMFLSSKKDDSEPMGPGCSDSDFYAWCAQRQRAVLVIGEYPQVDDCYGLKYVPIDGASFEYCIFTQENPSPAVRTYVEFMQVFYANECR